MLFLKPLEDLRHVEYIVDVNNDEPLKELPEDLINLLHKESP